MSSIGRVLTAKLLTLVLLASAFGVAFADSGSGGNGSGGSDSGNSGGGNSGSGNSGGGNSGGGNSGQDAPAPGRPQDQKDGNSDRDNQDTPVAGERMNAKGEGKVTVRLPNGKVVEVDEHASIPIGSVVDARDGSVKLTATGGQWAVFKGAVFQLRQASEGKRPVTELVLRGGDFSSCGPTGSAAFAAKKGRRKSVRGLWARGKGNFRTRGRHGAATVRGTKWYTADTCDGTLVKVKRGKVAVRDFARKRTVLVRKGERYLAKPAQRPARKSVSS